MSADAIDLTDPLVKRTDRLYYALRQDGWDPSRALDLLAGIVQSESWRQMGHQSLVEYLRARHDVAPVGLGLDDDEVRRLLAHRHKQEDLPDVAERMTLVREQVLKALDTPLPGPGEIGNGRSRSDVITPTQRGTSESYLRRRLKRDHPDLYEQVTAGALSASAAAKKAGIRKPYAQVRTDDVTVAVATLLKHFTADQIREALP